jgi:hypothetical protein
LDGAGVSCAVAPVRDTSVRKLKRLLKNPLPEFAMWEE